MIDKRVWSFIFCPEKVNLDETNVTLLGSVQIRSFFGLCLGTFHAVLGFNKLLF